MAKSNDNNQNNSNENKDFHYLKFPLCLLKETFTKKHAGIDLIIDYCIADRALSFDQYEFFEKIWGDLKDDFDDKLLSKLSPELNEFYIETNSKEVKKKWIKLYGEYDAFIENVPERIRVKCFLLSNYLEAQSQLEIRTKLNIDGLYDNYIYCRKLIDSIENQFDKDVYVSLKTDFLKDFSENKQDLDLFRCLVSVRSILRNYKFTDTHKSTIVCRMFGAKSKEVLNLFLDKSTKENDLLNSIYDTYSNRYHIDKLLDLLNTKKFITSLGWGRKIYLTHGGNNPMNLSQMILEKQRAKQNKESRQKAIDYLKANTQKPINKQVITENIKTQIIEPEILQNKITEVKTENQIVEKPENTKQLNSLPNKQVIKDYISRFGNISDSSMYANAFINHVQKKGISFTDSNDWKSVCSDFINKLTGQNKTEIETNNSIIQ
jgi:hypothetical protein